MNNDNDKDPEEVSTIDGLDTEVDNLIKSHGLDPEEAEEVVELSHELHISHEDAEELRDENNQNV